ncbi:MAG: HAD-IA family hydrolase [Candidatus Tectomicrobia bacterium]|uniref:phosphoglycolate phosphatase n=1 Tax=Tectimicrobiota bacterium TaxID=2528274 RepID=A0A932MND1_UNCTE|nr:HAD-IA family hydrolase [Candidatus Tectomicrobia bacterium]
MPPRAILFDHDGTLVDSYPGIALCMRLTCRDLGKPEMTDEEVSASIGPTLEDRFTELWGGETAREAARIYRAHYAVHFLSGTRLLDGVKCTLEALEARGVPMACVTNKSWNYCVRQLEHFGLHERMKVVYGNLQGFPPKPDPAMALAALEVLGVPPEEAVLVGDTAIDVRTAHAAGVQAWVVPSEYTSIESIERAKPHKILKNFKKILQYI